MTKLEELQELLLEMSNPKGYSLLKIDELMPKTVLHLCKLACCLDENLESPDRKRWTSEVLKWLTRINNLSNVKTDRGRLTYSDYTERLKDRYEIEKIKTSILDLVYRNYPVRKDYLITRRGIQEEFLELITNLVKKFFESQFLLLSENKWDQIIFTDEIELFISECYKENKNDNETTK